MSNELGSESSDTRATLPTILNNALQHINHPRIVSLCSMHDAWSQAVTSLSLQDGIPAWPSRGCVRSGKQPTAMAAVLSVPTDSGQLGWVRRILGTQPCSLVDLAFSRSLGNTSG